MEELKDLNEKLLNAATTISNTENRLVQIQSSSNMKKHGKIENLKKNLNDFNKNKKRLETRIKQIVDENDDNVAFKKKYSSLKQIMKFVSKMEKELEMEENVELVEEIPPSSQLTETESVHSNEPSSDWESFEIENSRDPTPPPSPPTPHFDNEQDELDFINRWSHLTGLVMTEGGWWDLRECVERNKREQESKSASQKIREAFPSFFN